MKNFKFSFFCIILTLGISGCSSVLYKDHYNAIEQAKSSGSPILLYLKEVSSPNSAGGVNVNISFQNFSEKSIKYVIFDVLPYNAVGDVVSSEIGGKAVATLKFTGPSPYDEYEYSRWENVWYNNSVRCIEIVKLEIIYMDGSEISFEKSDIENISSSELSYPFNDASSKCGY